MVNTLQIDSLYKQYGCVCAVENISFSAKRGEIIALLGPNGAGKSSLMNMIAGLIAPTSGNICVNNYDIRTNTIEAKKSIGFLAEGAPMYGDMSVKSFLRYMAELKELNQIDDRLNMIKEMAQIENVWDMRIENLSKGYQRRVGFAQSILADPPILLLDEPTDGLDPNQKEHIRKLIKSLGERKTIIISTHLLDDVEEMCNRIMIINQGRIVADGDKYQILQIAKSRSLATAFRKLTGGKSA